jgi:hypothetical protein
METRIPINDIDLPRDIWKNEIIPFLSSHDQKAFACVSRTFNSYIPATSAFSEEWKRNNKMWKIESELKKLNLLIAYFENEISKKSFFSQRINKKTLGILSALLILSGLHIFVDCILGKSVSQISRLESLLDSSFLPFNNQTCTEMLSSRKELNWCLGNSNLWNHPFNASLSLCYEICKMIQPSRGNRDLSIVGVVLSSILILILFGVLFAIDKGKNRFNPLSPNDFSLHMQHITKELLNEFRLNENNPFENIDLNNTIEEIVTIANATKIEEEKEYKQLLDEKNLAKNKQELIEMQPEEEKYFSKPSYNKWMLFKKSAFLDSASIELLSEEHKTFEPI